MKLKMNWLQQEDEKEEEKAGFGRVGKMTAIVVETAAKDGPVCPSG